MNFALRQVDLHVRHPFTTARGTTGVQSAVVVELEQDGLRGYGEAPQVPYYRATAAGTQAALEQLRPQIEAARLDDPIDLWEQFQPLLEQTPAAACALDVAAHDLWGKLHGMPLWKLWGLETGCAPWSDYTIGIDSVDDMLRKLAEFPDFPVYKIKLGTSADLSALALRQQSDAVFRVDANCGWTVEQMFDNGPELMELDVELIEQPLPPERWDAMRRVFSQSPLPLLADESCRGLRDLEHCAACFHGVNIKLAKCGGLTPARRMIVRARQLGLRVMIGCFLESTINISAAAQLAPLADYVDLDGALLLADDIARGVCIKRGRLVYPAVDGCGVTLAPGMRG